MLQTLREIPKWTLPLRRWQGDAVRSWAERKPENELWIATPGAGKTLASSRLVHALLRSGEVDQVVFVVPREGLKEQTARALGRVGINVEHNFSNAEPVLPRDMHGCVVTYQQVSFAPHAFANLMRRRTIVILDEIHHAGDATTWGDALKAAFSGAAYRLSMSGTPFRTDGCAIPFVEYELDECVAGVNYDYSAALADGVCRPLVFALIEGEASWISRDGTQITATFGDKLTKDKQPERLRTHLMSDSLGEIILQAHRDLLGIRASGHPAAGALLVAMNQDHARQLAGLVQLTTGTKATLVLSEEDDSQKRIRQFAQSDTPWMVAVHMVSEGTDIPRLRLGVYASNVKTEMYFRQFCGRFVRIQRDLQGQQNAYVYIPADPTLLAIAKNIRGEVIASIKARKLAADELPLGEAEPGEDSLRGSAGESFYAPVSSSLGVSGSLHGDLPLALEGGFQVNVQERDPQASLFPTQIDSEPFIGDEREALKKKIRSLVAQVTRMFDVPPGKVNATLKMRFNGSVKTASLDGLRDRQKELLTWIKQKKYNGYR